MPPGQSGLEVGGRLGKYTLTRSLGRGGMGEVFEAHDPDIDRRVAIKTIHPHLVAGGESADYLERFRREARATARCQHPNIVSILEYGEFEGQVYLIMEFVDGVPLDELVKSEPIDLRRSLGIVVQLLRALDCAHDHDIVHRDIKPSNLLIAKSRERTELVKLTDFGIARDHSHTGMTQVGMAVGTPDYMAPEQAFGLPVDARSDLFAVGVILHQLLAAQPSLQGVPRRSLDRIPGLPPSTRVDLTAPVPESFLDLLRSALSSHAPERPQSAKRFARMLKEAARNLRQPGQPATTARMPSADAATRVGPALTNEAPTDPSAAAADPLASDPFGALSGLDEDTVTRVRDQLSDILGDAAPEVVRKARTGAISFAEFLHGVAASIPDERSKKRFLKDWDL